MSAFVLSIVLKRSRPEFPPTPDHGQAEDRVANRECPERCLVEKHLSQPVGDESPVVSLIPSACPQIHFQRGERTNHPEPRLHHHHCDPEKVGGTEPRISDPSPTSKTADEDQQQPAHHERDEREVK